MDDWGWEQLRPWLNARLELPCTVVDVGEPTHVASLRRRLHLAFEELQSYGIVALDGYGQSRAAVAETIVDELKNEFPDASGAFIFWTRPDESSFLPDGQLQRPLVMHCSSDAEVATALAICCRHDVIAFAATTPDGPVVTVDPAEQPQ